MKESIDELVAITRESYEYLNTLEKEVVEVRVNDKWSVNEEVIHLILSLSPLLKALKMPKFQLKLLFGTAKRNVYSFDEVEKLYQDKLGQGAVAPKSYVPKVNKFKTQKELFDKWLNKTLEFEKLLNKWSQADLDKVLLPHPSLGKLTVSELVHFTLIHTKMHLQKIKKP